MAYYKATIEVLVEAESWAEACDAIAEGLRPMLREYCDTPTAWIDWHYFERFQEFEPIEHDGSGFELVDRAS